jgi:uncharacterized protein YndB with AHSA1/START domain
MAASVEHSIAIPRPPAQVFRAASDPFEQLNWDHAGLKRVEALTEGGLRPGARYRGTFKGMGSIEYEFVEYEPDVRFAHLARTPVGMIRHTFTFGPTPEGTRMTQVGELVPRGVGALVAPLVRRMLVRRFGVIARELRRYVFAGGGATD